MNKEVELNFIKMHGLGNDFVIIQNIDSKSLDKEQIKYLCDRKLGIGCDQLIICNNDDGKYVDMKIFNCDY